MKNKNVEIDFMHVLLLCYYRISVTINISDSKNKIFDRRVKFELARWWRQFLRQLACLREVVILLRIYHAIMMSNKLLSGEQPKLHAIQKLKPVVLI